MTAQPEAEPLAEADPPEVVWDKIAWCGPEFRSDLFPEVIASPADYVPLMVKTLRSIAAEPSRYVDEADHDGQTFALLLLAQLRSQAAFPDIVGFLRAIKGMEDGVLQDLITESLPAVLASTFDGNLDALKAIVEDGEADEFVRGAALISIGSLVVHGRIDRAVLVAYVDHLLGHLEREPAIVWEELAGLIADFAIEEHRGAIAELRDEGLVDPAMFSDAEVEAGLAAQGRLDGVPIYRLIDDAAAEAGLLRDVGDPNGHCDYCDCEDHLDPGGDSELGERDEAPGVPFVRESAKVGRNDPCPCGSGKKHKKCCGA